MREDFEWRVIWVDFEMQNLMHCVVSSALKLWITAGWFWATLCSVLTRDLVLDSYKWTILYRAKRHRIAGISNLKRNHLSNWASLKSRVDCWHVRLAVGKTFWSICAGMLFHTSATHARFFDWIWFDMLLVIENRDIWAMVLHETNFRSWLRQVFYSMSLYAYHWRCCYLF